MARFSQYSTIQIGFVADLTNVLFTQAIVGELS